MKPGHLVTVFDNVSVSTAALDDELELGFMAVPASSSTSLALSTRLLCVSHTLNLTMGNSDSVGCTCLSPRLSMHTDELLVFLETGPLRDIQLDPTLALISCGIGRCNTTLSHFDADSCPIGSTTSKRRNAVTTATTN